LNPKFSFLTVQSVSDYSILFHPSNPTSNTPATPSDFDSLLCNPLDILQPP
jgi:hypothetical protein